MDTIAQALYDMHCIKSLPRGYQQLCKRVKEYVNDEFNYETRIAQWDSLITDTIQTWKTRYNRYKMEVM